MTSPLTPSAEQLEVTKRVANRLARKMPKDTGVMDYEDVQQMAVEALLMLMAKGPLPEDKAHLGMLVRSRTIDLLRTQGILTQSLNEEGKREYVRHEAPSERQSSTSLNPQSMEVLRLSFEEDLSTKQIGELLGRTAGGVSVTKSKALRALRGEQDGLTKREHEVLAASASGLTNRETAKELHISEHTVRSHAKAAIKALHAKNTTHAVAIAFQKGLLT